MFSYIQISDFKMNLGVIPIFFPVEREGEVDPIFIFEIFGYGLVPGPGKKWIGRVPQRPFLSWYCFRSGHSWPLCGACLAFAAGR